MANKAVLENSWDGVSLLLEDLNTSILVFYNRFLGGIQIFLQVKGIDFFECCPTGVPADEARLYL